MTADQIHALGPALSDFLDEFSDCFKSGDTRQHLKDYVKGQLSDLPRKSVEPMARLAEVPPRTLQEFLSLSNWDHDLLRARLQQLVARDHAVPNAILPVITFVGISVGQLTGGAVVTETIFSMPGTGRLFVASIEGRDFPVMLAIGMLIVVGVVLMNLLADIAYAFVNPQIRHG